MGHNRFYRRDTLYVYRFLTSPFTTVLRIRYAFRGSHPILPVRCLTYSFQPVRNILRKPPDMFSYEGLDIDLRFQD
jgi:hypothetical protein